MEFQECYSLLATRPAHAHEHCEDEQHAETKQDDVNISKSEEIPDSKLEDLAQLSVQALAQTFHRLQETRVQIYADFRQSVAAIV